MIAYEEVQLVVERGAAGFGGDVDAQQVFAGPLGQLSSSLPRRKRR
ncbi:hypothetical protein [Nonomuraea maheshkhaliensis]